MRRIILAVALSLSLAGCGAGSKVGGFIDAATSTIANPVGQVDIYRVKNAYAGALELVVSYREYCWSRPYAVLMADPISKPICQNRRSVVRAAQRGKANARAAIVSADNFVRNNPTLNAATAISAAWQAVTDFQNTIPRVN